MTLRKITVFTKSAFRFCSVLVAMAGVHVVAKPSLDIGDFVTMLMCAWLSAQFWDSANRIQHILEEAC